jgi:serine protease AprX
VSRAVLGICVAAAIAVAGGGATPAMVSAKVDPRVVADTARHRSAAFLVVLDRQADVAAAVTPATDRASQGRLAVDALRAQATAQQGVRAELRRLGVRFRSFWVVNAIAVRGDRSLVARLARRDDVRAIEPDRTFRAVAATTATTSSAAPRGVEWNVQKIGAPEVWALGFTGQGMTYANADTGVRWDAPSLKSRYRGFDGATVNHAYSWWDAVHGDIDGNGTNPCGFSVRAPCDDTAAESSHGTHTMGTAVGDDGAGNQIGVAPGARWIACRNMDEGVGRPSTYIECLQFFLAPTDLDGANPDPTRRPNVIGNSYSCPPDEGCSVGALQAAVDALRAAGIFMAVAAGNEGREGCSTVQWPPGTYDSSISVGATDAADVVARFSSRGPVTADGSNRLKPDLVAPGVGIRSSTASGYGVLSGTSMAAPHVGGAVLLLWSAFPQLVGDVDATEQLLEKTAVPRTTTDACGGDTSTAVPNNTAGYGRIDVAAAARSLDTSTPPTISIAGVSVLEGNAGRGKAAFAVTLGTVSTRTVSVGYSTKAGTATPGKDFVAVSGRLSFAPGERAKTVDVPIVGDRAVEANETFAVVLSGPTNARLGRAKAIGTIRNDDRDRTAPSLTKLTVTPRPVVAGRRATLGFSLSERAVVRCTIDRRDGTRWVTVRRPSGRFARGPNSLAFATSGLAGGVYRTACVATDAAGNAGRRVTASFGVS